MAALVHGPLAEALAAGRERYNALFASARRAAPQLDPAAFGQFLAGAVQPVVERVAAAAPDRAPAVTDELYELSLEIVSKDLPGRCPGFLGAWRDLLCGLPQPLAEAPRAFAGSVTNALYNLETTPGARPREWAEVLLRLGAAEPSPSALLEAGKVLAWRAGMAHYRESALAACQTLPSGLACRALGLEEAAGPRDLAVILERLRLDPWLHPAYAANGGAPRRALKVAARVGAFRGFGGAFLTPPRLVFSGEQFFAWDGEACWALHADLFGATLHRVGTAPPRPDGRAHGAFTMERGGVVRCGPHAQAFPELRETTSSASDRATLAATVPLSHAVYLVALVPEGP